MQAWINNVQEEFIERFLRQRVERLENGLNELYRAIGVHEDIDAYLVNRSIGFEETAGQYQLRCRIEILDQRMDRMYKAFKNLESDALCEAMRRLTEFQNIMKAS